MSKSVVPEIMAILVPYLAERANEWRASPGTGPTLPHKRECGLLSVHVGELVRHLGLNPEWRQHFKKQSLRTIVNAACLEQGLIGIGEVAPPRVPAATANVELPRGTSSPQGPEVKSTLLWQAQRIAELEGRLGMVRSSGLLIDSAASEEP